MARRPNVIVFFTDQQRHDTTGIHHCPLGLTPPGAAVRLPSLQPA